MVKRLIPHCTSVEQLDAVEGRLAASEPLVLDEVLRLVDSFGSSMQDEWLDELKREAHRQQRTPELFLWTPSQLTLALQHGDWLVIEDVDHVNSTILPKLVPVVRCREGQPLPFYVNGVQLSKAPGFRVFFTDSSAVPRALQYYCYVVHLARPPDNPEALAYDVCTLAAASFPHYPPDHVAALSRHLLASRSEDLRAHIADLKLRIEPLLARGCFDVRGLGGQDVQLPPILFDLPRQASAHASAIQVHVYADAGSARNAIMAMLLYDLRRVEATDARSLRLKEHLLRDVRGTDWGDLLPYAQQLLDLERGKVESAQLAHLAHS